MSARPFALALDGGDARSPCSECGGRLVADAERGELSCASCGLVAAAPAFDLPAPVLAPARPSRAPPFTGTLPLRGASRLARRDRDARRPAKGARRARRIAERAAHASALPDYVVADALARVRQAAREGATSGRRLEATIAAALVEAARDRGVPRSLREIAAAAGASGRETTLAHRALARLSRSRVLPARPERFLARIGSDAGLPPRLVGEAAALLGQPAARAAASSRRPETAAAAALVAAARRARAPVSVLSVARAAGASRQAVHEALKLLAGPCPGS